MEFSEGLERIEIAAFSKSGVEHVVLPASTRVIGAYAFACCEHLRSVRLNEGLEVLGEKRFFNGKMCKGGVFLSSALEDITIPPTLGVAEYGTFEDCKALKRVEFPEGIESLGRDDKSSDSWGELFKGSGVKEVVLPSTLREMSPNIFKDCGSLKTVWVAKGCKLNIRLLVGFFVRVKQSK